MNAPIVAASIVNRNSKCPIPTSLNIGPGHAPVIAHPSPKIEPPINAALYFLGLGVICIVSPSIVFICLFLINWNRMAPNTTD